MIYYLLSLGIALNTQSLRKRNQSIPECTNKLLTRKKEKGQRNFPFLMQTLYAIYHDKKETV